MQKKHVCNVYIVRLSFHFVGGWVVYLINNFIANRCAFFEVWMKSPQSRNGLPPPFRLSDFTFFRTLVDVLFLPFPFILLLLLFLFQDNSVLGRFL